MKALKLIYEKKLYILSNIIIFLVGYILINRGLTLESSDKSGAVYISIGTSLIATGVVTILDLWKHLTISSMLEKLSNIIVEAGLEWVYPKRDLDKYDKLMKNLSAELDIAGYSLGAFFDSYSDILKRKLKASGNIRVRILIVHPESVHSIERAKIEGKDPVLFRERVLTLVDFFKGIKGIEIRFIEAPLSTMIFRVDETLFVGPHFYRKQSKATLTYQLKRGHWLYDEYQDEFDRMWNDATETTS